MSEYMKRHKLYCIIGRTGSGKSTITKQLCIKEKMSVVKSYTTRAMRDNETEETTDHTHISSSEVDKYRSDMVAYTERVGYCSFATLQQIKENNFYIINPQGFYDLQKYIKDNHLDEEIQLISVYIRVPFTKLRKNALNRGDYESWQENYKKENDEFVQFEKNGDVDYYLLNDTLIDDAYDKLKRIVNITKYN